MKKSRVSLCLSISVITMAITIAGMVCAALGATPNVLVLKDFEGKLKYDAKSKTIRDAKGAFYNNFYSGPTSAIEGGLVAVPGCKGEKALYVKWNNADYAGCGFSVPAKAFTADYSSFNFMVKGTGTYLKYKIILGDAGNESYVFVIEDDSQEWQSLEIPLSDFKRREDYQPANSDNDAELDFPIASFNLEVVDAGTLELWIDAIEAVK